MGVTVVQSYLSDLLHIVSQGLLIPTILLLLIFIGYSLYCIGSIVSEYFNERKHFTVTMPKFLSALMKAKQDEIPQVIEESGLLNRQKVALLTVYDYRTLPGDALVALIRRLVSEEETRYDRISGRNNMAARISPMIGLMGTLIPLGPGVEALGRADTSALSSSLLIAFDTTVAGLVVAAICLIIGKIRSNWYGNYMSALDAAMATMLEKIEDMREAGEITIEEPSDYAFIFESEHGKAKASADKAADKKAEEDVEAAAHKAAEERAASEARSWAEAAAVAQAQTKARTQSQSQTQDAVRRMQQSVPAVQQVATQEMAAQQVAPVQQAVVQQAQPTQQPAATPQSVQQAQPSQQQAVQQAQPTQQTQQPVQQAQSAVQQPATTQQQPAQNAFVLRQPVGLGDNVAKRRSADDPGSY